MKSDCTSCIFNKNEISNNETDAIIKGIQITGSQLVINYNSDTPIEKKYSCNESTNKCNEDSTGKYLSLSDCEKNCKGSSPPPSTSGKCISTNTHPDFTDSDCEKACNTLAWCPKKCGESCCDNIYGGNYCKWKPTDPCINNPCKNGGICTSSIDNSSYTCSCKGCYTGLVCTDVNCSSGCTGGAGCIPQISSNNCSCECDSSCYKIDNQTNKCILKDCGDCSGGVCVCQNGELKCNKNPPLDKYLVGYYCPSCPSSSNLSKSDLLSSKYNIIILAFINFDANGVLSINTDPNNCWGGTGSGSNNGNVCPTSDIINDIKKSGKKVIGSIGGGAGGIMNISNVSKSYINTFVSSAIRIIKEFNLDGIDFDIEHRSGSSSADYEIIGLTVREIARQINNNGYIVTAAPQCSNLGSCTCNSSSSISAGNNALVSMFGIPSKTVISKDITFDKDLLRPNPFWVVFPQMYNSWTQVETPSSISNYWNKMTSNGFVQNGTLANYIIKFNTTNFIIGFPSASSAAGSGYIKPTIVVDNILKSNKTLRGVMTWDIGADFTNNFDFSNTIGDYLQF